ncbi:MAG: signal peptidase I [Lachnospiraceae bacterium]|nr:signal peptidase I [Lachnospiraceae bacterium]
MKTVFRSFFNALVWVIVLVLLFFVFSGLYQRFLNQSRHTGLLGIGYAVVVSGSMEPAIMENDMIVYQAQPKDAYEVGDVIVYVRDAGLPSEKLISHRIVSIGENTMIVKGDANATEDAPITKEQVVGRMAFYIPKVGKAVSFLKTPLGYGCISALIVLLIAVNLISMKREKKEKKES